MFLLGRRAQGQAGSIGFAILVYRLGEQVVSVDKTDVAVPGEQGSGNGNAQKHAFALTIADCPVCRVEQLGQAGYPERLGGVDVFLVDSQHLSLLHVQVASVKFNLKGLEHLYLLLVLVVDARPATLTVGD
jgi:hypothetical protein